MSRSHRQRQRFRAFRERVLNSIGFYTYTRKDYSGFYYIDSSGALWVYAATGDPLRPYRLTERR